VTCIKRKENTKMRGLIAVVALVASVTTLNLQADQAVAYTVAEGDTIHTIAGKYEVAVEDILVTNGLQSEEIEVGTVLFIPPVHAKGYFNPENGDYTFVAGDDLYAVAERFGTTVEKIREANELESDEVEVGETIYIPD